MEDGKDQGGGNGRRDRKQLLCTVAVEVVGLEGSARMVKKVIFSEGCFRGWRRPKSRTPP
jgi:hypothetical protein